MLGFVWKVSRSATLYMVWSFFIWKTLRDPSVFFFCFLRFWLAEGARERETESMIVKEKPFRLTRKTRYLEIWLRFRLSSFEMCCDFDSILLPPKQKIIDFNFQRLRSLWHHFKPDFRWNISFQKDKYRKTQRAIEWHPSQAWPKSIQTNSFTLISIAISFKNDDEHNSLLFVSHSISVWDIF